ncbi:hypothetical protein [Chengkuizengella sediminis]|uniref:hypothetical protein n=1 Tax=Chengkuizengella sediminis TaxID=1885917 RepID=UPI001389FDF9|nr:hypothetical protein [Chengkuizengella sediminis]NDI35637.1 hypothetical protein [Chengkuizengella sediminis]
MSPTVFFAQTDRLIELPETGEEIVLLNLEIPKCYKHNSFKLDGFFELNFLLGATEPLQSQGGSYKLALDYQLLDGIGDNCREVSPRLAETISGSISKDFENNYLDVLSNTTPNLTVVCEELQESFYLVASVREIQGAAFLPTVQFRSLNATTVFL